jgi:glycosyltransferase involved in cell wall biosynthesis
VAEERTAREEPTKASRHILILGSYAPSLINFRGPLIAAMIARGHRVTAAAPAIDQATAEALGRLGADWVSVPLSNASLSATALLSSYRKLAGLVSQVRPDVVFSYTVKPVILGALAARRAPAARVISLITGVGFAFTGKGGSSARRLARWGATILYRAALRRSDLVLFQNQDDRALFAELGLLSLRTPSAVVSGSGVDLEKFRPTAKPAGTSFLMIARLLRDKGIREFAEAVRRLREEHPEVPVALAGYLDPSPDSLTRAELDELVAAGLHFHG